MISNRILVIDEDDVLSKAVRRALEWTETTEEILWLWPTEDVLATARAERFAMILLGTLGDARGCCADFPADVRIADLVNEA